MPNDHNDPKAIWKNQPIQASTVLLEKMIRNKVRSLYSKTRNALFRHIAAQVFVIALSATGIALAGNPWQRTAFAIALLWALTGLYGLHRGLWSPALPGDAALTTSLAYYRGEIERRRSLSQRYLTWLFGPLMLFMAAFVATLFMLAVKNRAFLNMLPFLTLLVIWLATVFVLRLRDQRELQREIEELNDIEKERF